MINYKSIGALHRTNMITTDFITIQKKNIIAYIYQIVFLKKIIHIQAK